MPEKYKNSGLLMHELTIKPYSMATIDFLDVKPNYFRVQNFGDTRIYCGTSRTPTENNYDFVCKPDGMFMYAEPNPRSFLYIYNPSGNETRVKLIAFAHDFDPLALVFSGIELDFSGTKLEADTAISSFNASLPSGSNNIGKVGVASLPATAPTLAKQNEIISKLSALVDANANNFVDDVQVYEQQNQDGTQQICNGGSLIVHLLTNDGDTDFTVNFVGTSSTQSMTLKPGETIQDFKWHGGLNLNGTGYSFRAVVSYV